MQKYLWLTGILFLVVYFWGVNTLVRAHQADILLVVNILVGTFSMWGAWYAFLLKKFFLCISILILLCYALWHAYFAVLEVISPELM